MNRTIDYGTLMHRAMRGLIEQVLSVVAADGLPGEHHFFIKFDTSHPGVKIAPSLKERYPEEMMVILQHEYENLVTDAQGFGVTLSFGNKPEVLFVPYDAILTFVDPSVEFGLRFESHEGEDDEDDDDDEPDAPPKDAEIVSLDSWRK